MSICTCIFTIVNGFYSQLKSKCLILSQRCYRKWIIVIRGFGQFSHFVRFFWLREHVLSGQILLQNR